MSGGRVSLSQVMTVRGSGATVFHGAMIYMTTTQALGAASGTAVFDTVHNDSDGYFSGGHIVIPTGLGGRYTIAGQLALSASEGAAGNGTIWETYISVGSSRAANNRISSLVGGGNPIQIMPVATTAYVLADGDAIYLVCNTFGGTPANVSISGVTDFAAYVSFLSLHRIGDAP